MLIVFILKLKFCNPFGQLILNIYVLESFILTTLFVSIPLICGGLTEPHGKTLIWISRITLPINTPFLYSSTFIARIPAIIPGGFTHILPVI